MALLPEINIIIGHPGAGKTTAFNLLSGVPGIVCLDADEFISPEGIKALQTGKWNDGHRRAYLTATAVGVVNELKSRPDEKIVVVDAMTTDWMRKHFEKELRNRVGNHTLNWILLTRFLSDNEIAEIVEKRGPDHPMNTVQTFKKYVEAFEPMKEQHKIVNNPGPVSGEAVFLQLLLDAINGN